MTAVDRIPDIVQELRDGFRNGALRDIESRRVQLRRLRALFVEQEDRLIDALVADVGKPRIEAYTTEIAFTINEIDHTLKHLDSWTKPEKVKVPLTFKPGSATLRPEPLGTVCIIAPWNYPVQLLFAPLVPALAAGNTAVLKPSEVTPTVAALIEELVPVYFEPSTVAVVTGAAEETTALLEQRFDHIFYTGNGNGRQHRDACRRRAPHPRHARTRRQEPGDRHRVRPNIEVSCAIGSPGAKFLNAGQTCVAPDYVLVDELVEDQLTSALAAAVTSFYGDDPRQSNDYARIVNERHHDRLMKLLEAGGYDATVIGGTGDRASRYLAPTVLAGVKPDAAVMDDEIFGPILPVLAVGDVDEAIRFVNDREKPLALYAFSSDDDTLEHVVANTSAGGVTLNHAVLHLAVPDLPFGGVGESGMGAYHGKAGFDTFSHLKAVLAKPTRPDPALMYPPYTNLKKRILHKFM
jgi:aldehyde dehydrogenase (NAD+)